METSPFVPHWTEAGKVPSADSTYQVPVEGLQITLSARESPDTCAPRATSPAVPHTIATVPPPEKCTYQVPVDGRNTAMSVTPFPSKSPGTGMSPAAPHCTEG